MKKLPFSAFLFFTLSSFAQVPRKVFVGHFTNTYFSTCASRNPGLYGNLSNFPDLLHVTYHPSSPYKQCPLNQYNKDGNDSRTNYYGVYGSTPRIAVNGQVIPIQTNYANSQFIDDVNSEQSNYSLEVSWSQIGPNDSVRVDVNITLEGTAGAGEGKMFIGLFQDTVYMTNQNGEKNPPHVYRGGPLGLATTMLPTVKGNSVKYQVMLPSLSGLENASLYAVAILYDKMESYEQSAHSASHTSLPTRLTEEESPDFFIYPNPATRSLFHSLDQDIPVLIRDMNGKIQFHGIWKKASAISPQLKPGVYFVQSEIEGQQITKRLVIRL